MSRSDVRASGGADVAIHQQEQRQQQPLKWSDLQAVFATNDGGDKIGGDDHALFCFNCRDEGHTVAHCPHPRRCYICLKSSHQGYQCTENPVQGSVVFRSDARCEYCHDKGHSAIFCRKPGGAAHGRRADTVYSRPLVLHAPRDGPNEADVKKGRQKILDILKRLHGAATPNCNVAAVVTISDLPKMRDSEFFCAVLPLLNDPSTSGMPADDRMTIRQCLYAMRGAVAGGIQLGVPRTADASGSHKRKQRALGVSAIGDVVGGVNDDRDLLYDMKTSGLDINVLHNGKLDVFHRTRPATRFGTAAHEAKQPHDAQLCHPGGVIADTVYLASQHRGGSPGGGTKTSPAGSPKALHPDAVVRPVDRLEANLEQLFARKQHILNSTTQQSRRVQAQIVASSLRTGPALKGRAQGGSGARASSTTSSDGRSRSAEREREKQNPYGGRFIAPVPPHTRQKDDVAKEVLHRWAVDGPVKPPQSQVVDSVPTTRPAKSAPMGETSPRMGALSAVRAFMSNATLRFGDSQQRWSQSGGSATSYGQGPSPHMQGTPIMNWDRYRKSCPPTLPSAPPPKGDSSLSKGGTVSQTHRGDVVAQWRERFDYSKTASTEAVDQMLMERAMHRCMVAGDGTRYESLASGLVQQATRPSTSSTRAKRGSRQGNHTPVLGEHGSNLWTVHCGVLANDEAEATLRRAVVEEVRSYAERIHCFGDEGSQHSGSTTSFLAELSRFVLTVQTPEELRRHAGRLVDMYGERFRSGRALLTRLVDIATSLFQEMQVAQQLQRVSP